MGILKKTRVKNLTDVSLVWHTTSKSKS